MLASDREVDKTFPIHVSVHLCGCVCVCVCVCVSALLFSACNFLSVCLQGKDRDPGEKFRTQHQTSSPPRTHPPLPPVQSVLSMLAVVYMQRQCCLKDK